MIILVILMILIMNNRVMELERLQKDYKKQVDQAIADLQAEVGGQNG